MVRPGTARAGLRAPAQGINYVSSVVTPRIVAADPGPAITLTQTDVVADHLDNRACSALALGNQTENIELRAGGPAGTVPLSFNVTTEAPVAQVFMLSAYGEPGMARWDAGPWNVRLSITGGGSGASARWRRCHICRVGNDGTNRGLIAFGNLNVACSDGTKSVTLEGKELTGDPLDRVQIVLGFSRPAGTVTVQITPDRNIDTPILTRAA